MNKYICGCGCVVDVSGITKTKMNNGTQRIVDRCKKHFDQPNAYVIGLLKECGRCKEEFVTKPSATKTVYCDKCKIIGIDRKKYTNSDCDLCEKNTIVEPYEGLLLCTECRDKSRHDEVQLAIWYEITKQKPFNFKGVLS